MDKTEEELGIFTCNSTKFSMLLSQIEIELILIMHNKYYLLIFRKKIVYNQIIRKFY